jgi:predicted nucleotidyltransferase
MALMKLHFSTGGEEDDRILGGVIGIWESVFPSRIRAYYLFGSHVAGSADSTSDLDLAVVFKQGFQSSQETDQAQRLCEYLEALQPAPFVDMFYVSEESVQQPDRVSIALLLKRSSVLLYGEDTRQRITAEPDERYVRDAMHIPYFNSKFGRSNLNVLTFPFDYPDTQGEFFGYDGWLHGGERSTLMLVVMVGRIATALLALKAGQYAGSKSESTRLYRAHINDEWSDLVEQVYQRCRVDWGYRIPDEQSKRQLLRVLCQQALDFENYFYGLYREFLLRELQDQQREHRLRAIERSGQIIYSGADILGMLRTIADQQADDAELREAAETAIGTIQTVLAPTTDEV